MRKRATEGLLVDPIELRSEGEVQKDILDWLKKHGFWVWRNANQAKIRGGGKADHFFAPSDNPGSPDIFGVLPDGKMLMIEVKKEGWKPPKEPPGCKASDTWQRYALQKYWIDRCNARGGLAFFAQSVTEVEYLLAHYIKREPEVTSGH